MSLVRPALVVGAATAASRLLGFARDILIARLIGAGPVADAFLLALRLPNLLRRVVAEGGVNAGFVPLIARVGRERGEAEAQRFAGDVIAAGTLALVVIAALAELAAPLIVLALAPGYADAPATWALASLYTRLALPFAAAATLASVLAAILNAQRRFAVAALAPAAVNVVLVAAVVAVGQWVADPADAAAWLAGAFSLAGFVQLAAIAIAVARLPHRPAWRQPRLTGDVRRLVRIGLPALVASGAAQFVVLVATQVASATPSAVSWLYYADRLFQLPLSFVGIALGTVLLPDMAAGAKGGLGHALNRALEAGLALALPAAVALVVLAEPIAGVLFERGAFGPADTAGTAAALAGLACGLPAGVAGKVLSQAFFARQSVRLPLLAGLAALVATAAGALLLDPVFGVGGIAFGAAIGLCVHAAALAVTLRREGLWRPDARLAARLPRLLAASLVMGLAVYGLHLLLAPQLAAAGSVAASAALVALCLAGIAVYAAAALLFGAIDRQDFKAISGGG